MARGAKRRQAKSKGLRSGFEYEVYKAAKKGANGVDLSEYYETQHIEWQPKVKKYCPDFSLPNGIIVEVKGRLTQADRVKHLAIKEQHPDLDIRFVFQYDNKLSTSSNTRYSDWAEKHDIPYAFKEIPKTWLS